MNKQGFVLLLSALLFILTACTQNKIRWVTQEEAQDYCQGAFGDCEYIKTEKGDSAVDKLGWGGEYVSYQFRDKRDDFEYEYVNYKMERGKFDNSSYEYYTTFNTTFTDSYIKYLSPKIEELSGIDISKLDECYARDNYLVLNYRIDTKDILNGEEIDDTCKLLYSAIQEADDRQYFKKRLVTIQINVVYATAKSDNNVYAVYKDGVKEESSEEVNMKKVWEQNLTDTVWSMKIEEANK